MLYHLLLFTDVFLSFLRPSSAWHTRMQTMYKKIARNKYYCTHLLLTLCHSEMFQPSKGHFQKVREVHFNTTRSTKLFAKCEIHLSEQQCVIRYAAATWLLRWIVIYDKILQINQPTRCNNSSSLLLDVYSYVQLNIFRASSRPSSGAQQLQ